jgi:putative ABC transport system substrate-binding protein
MNRRAFTTLAGGTAIAWPLAARAQRPALPVIGLITIGSFETRREEDLAAFHRGLAETGFVEGRNVAIEYRWTNGHNDQLPALAAELVRRQVAVIVTSGGPLAALAAKAATQTIPIVFDVGNDPVESGLVASFNRPGGNLTGAALLITAVLAKRLQMLHEAVPAATSVALLTNPANPVTAEAEVRELQAAARILGVHLLVLYASSPSEIEAAFTTLVQQRAGALFVSSDPTFTSLSDQIIALAARHAVPAMYQWRQYTEAGGLMSYGSSLPEATRIVGVYTGRILKGEKPADLPVQQVTKIELAINMKTAKALGITFPLTLLGRADEVIE